MGVSRSKYFLFFIILMFLTGTLRSQCLLSLGGKITDSDTREKLDGASITIRELALTTSTDSTGEFRFSGLCPGNYTIEITHIDCNPASFHIHLKEDERRDIQMPHKVGQLAEVMIVSGSKATPPGMAEELKGKALESVRGLSLGEALKQVSGVTALQTGSNIYKPVIHGLHSNRVLILNNGIRQEGQQWGSEHAPEIDPYIANRITVIKGASSIRYGGDAIGGVVLVEPKLLRYVPGVSGEVNAALFSNNLQGVLSAMVEGNSSRRPAFAWRLQGTVKRGGNAKTPDYWLANSGVSEINGSATAGWRYQKKGIEAFYSIFNTKLGIFSGSHIGNVTDLINAINSKEPPEYIRNADFSYAIGRPYQQVQHQLAKVKAYLNTGENSRLNLVLSGQYNRRREYDIVRTSRTAPQLELRLFTAMADLVWDHYAGKHLRGSIGATGMYQQNSYDYRYFIPNYKSWNTGVFAAEKFSWKKWQVEAGIRYDLKGLYQIHDNDQPPFDQLTGNEIAPGVPYGSRNFNGFSGNTGVTWKWTEGLRLSATIGTAWRSPQINEIYSDGLHHGAARIEKGNLNLLPERANSILGAVQYTGGGWNIDAGFYLKQITDFIYLKPTYPPELTIRGAFPTFKYEQTDARLTGFDLSAAYLFANHFQVSTKISILRAWDKKADDWLIQMPPDRGELALEYQFSDSRKWKQSYLKAGGLYVARQSRVPETGNIEVKHQDGSITMESDYLPPPDAYFLMSIEGGTDLILGGRPVSFILGVTNLLNAKYRDYMNAFRYFSDETGTNISLRVKVPFEFQRKKTS